MKVSVVIPVYNAEPFLRECLESVRRQSYQNLEILLIDDGSTDRSGDLCEEMARMDPRFRVLHKANGGVSSARNMGLQAVTGSYVLFVDADDYLEPNCVEEMARKAEVDEADIVYCEMFVDFPEEIYITHAFRNRPGRYTDRQVRSLQLATIPYQTGDTVDQMVFYGACCKLFRKKCLEPCAFIQGLKYGEDAIFNFQALDRAAVVSVSELPLYHYRKSGQSTTSAFRMDRVAQSVLRLKYTKAMLEATPDETMFMEAFDGMFINLSLYLVNELAKVRRRDKPFAAMAGLCRDTWMREQWKNIRTRRGDIRALSMLYSGNLLLAGFLLIRQKLK